jgi:hypothetical protein
MLNAEISMRAYPFLPVAMDKDERRRSRGGGEIARKTNRGGAVVGESGRGRGKELAGRFFRK